MRDYAAVVLHQLLPLGDVRDRARGRSDIDFLAYVKSLPDARRGYLAHLTDDELIYFIRETDRGGAVGGLRAALEGWSRRDTPAATTALPFNAPYKCGASSAGGWHNCPRCGAERV